MFTVTKFDDLRAILNVSQDDFPELDGYFHLDTAELAAINARFGLAFDPEGRDVRLSSWHSIRLLPYLVHSGYELPLLLEGRKQLAYMLEAYPPDRHPDEEKFDRYVAQGDLHKVVVMEPFEQPAHLENGRVLEGQRKVYYARKGEEWRIPAYRLIWETGAKCGWNEDFERLQGQLFGYEAWQNDWWLDDFRRRRGKFGCVPIHRAVSAKDLAWIDDTGFRAMPPAEDDALTVRLIYDRPDVGTVRKMMELGKGVAVVRLNVRSQAFMALIDGQPGPDYAIPAGRIKELNRNIVGEIEVIASVEIADP
jgi:hypothetical protein